MTELTDATGLERVRNFMLGLYLISMGRGWATLTEIAEMTGVHETCVPVNLGHLRERRYGGYVVEKRHRENVGTYEYQVREKAKLRPSTTLPPEKTICGFGKLDCATSKTYARRESAVYQGRSSES